MFEKERMHKGKEASEILLTELVSSVYKDMGRGD